jgi:hypothetical protein
MAGIARRQFLIAAAGVPAFALLAARAGAQGRPYRMAMLLTTSPGVTAPLQRALFDRLGELGYREGSNLVVESPLTLIQRTPIVEFANGRHLPAVYGFREFAEVGGAGPSMVLRADRIAGGMHF